MRLLPPFLAVILALTINSMPVARAQREPDGADRVGPKGTENTRAAVHLKSTGGDKGKKKPAGNAGDARIYGGEIKHHKEEHNKVQGERTEGHHVKEKRAQPSATPNRINTSPAVLSDRRMKTNISFVGRSPMGIPIYQFSYINAPNKRYQGTIAQALVRIRPDAIVWRNGLMFVDYSRLDVRMEELPQTPVPDVDSSNQ